MLHAKFGAQNPRRRLPAALLLLQTARIGPRQTGRGPGRPKMAKNNPRRVRQQNSSPMIACRGGTPVPQPTTANCLPTIANCQPTSTNCQPPLTANRQPGQTGPKTVKNGKLQQWSATLGEGQTEGQTCFGHYGPVLTCSAGLAHFSPGPFRARFDQLHGHTGHRTPDTGHTNV